MLLLNLFPFILFCVVLTCAILPLRLRWRWKALLCVPALIVSYKFLLLHLIGGPRFFAPELPKAVLLAAAWPFSALFIFVLLLLIASAIYYVTLLVLALCKSPCRNRCRIWRNRVNGGLLICALLLAALGQYNATSDPQITPVTIRIPELPAQARGIRIAFLADLHADRITTTERIQGMVDCAMSAKPDLILLGGDMVDGSTAELGESLQPLKQLKAPLGVFGIPGNHEYYSGYQEWMDFFPSVGVKMLLNQRLSLPCGIDIAGVTDPNAHRFGLPVPDLKGVITEGNAPVVLLCHQPRLVKEAADLGADLILAGHTHGGMMWGFNQVVAAFNQGLVSGYYKLGDSQLYISNGAGIWNGFPLRLGVPAEVVLITLE